MSKESKDFRIYQRNIHIRDDELYYEEGEDEDE